MANKTFAQITVPCYDTDENENLRITSFMDYAQEWASISANRLGFGSDVLTPMKMAWVISRMKIVVDRLPAWGDKVTLGTWHKGPDGPFYIRDYELRDESEERIISATSSWVILGLEDRKIHQLEGLSDESKEEHEHVIEQSCVRLRVPRDLELTEAYTHKVVYSDIDRNGHVNNVKYMVWSIDCLDIDFLLNHKIKEAEINFIREATKGETVSIMKGFDGNAYYIQGMVDGAISFVTKLTF
ncbi:MAG: thioesterase [Bacteroidales bacterium]|nr:thioesterase [Bacteroidales bacterium]